MGSLSKEELVEGFRVQTIQEATLRVISRRGLAGATMQEIADEAGVAKGTIYLYFRSRDALLQRSAEDALSKLLETLEATLESPRPFEEQLRGLIEAKLKFFDAHREFFRLYVAVTQGELAAPSRARRRHHEQYEVHLGRLAAFFREARRRGALAPLDPFRLALFVAEGMNAIILRRLSEEAPPPVESEVDWIVRTLLGGDHRQGARPLRAAIAVVLLCAVPCVAQEVPGAAAPVTLTLEDAWTCALKDSLAVGRARAEVAVADSQKKAALSLVLPRLSVGANAVRNSDEVTFGAGGDSRTILPRNDWSLRATLFQPVFAGLREKRAYDQAKEGIESARQGLRASEDDVLLRVASDYLDVVFGDALMEVERRSVELAEKRRKQAADFFEAGESTRVEVLQAEAALKAAERRRVTFRQARDRAAGELRVELGLEGEIEVREPEDTLPPLAPEADLVAQAIEGRPEVRRARSGVRIAELEVQKQQGAYLPVLTADAGYVRQKTTFPKDEYAFAGLRVTVPVFQGGEVGARVAIARQRRRQAELDLAEAGRRAREDVNAALLDLQAATTSLALANEQLAAAQAQYDQVFELYRAQEATSLDVEAAENGLADARRAVVTDRLRRKLTALRVRHAAGSLKAAVAKEVLP